jgi:hypothetical protein
MKRSLFAVFTTLAMTGSVAACSASQSADCPPGQYYDDASGSCFAGGGQCPPGQMWNGQGCVVAGGSQCPPGQMWNGQYCAPTTGGACPAGQAWNGQACVPQPVACPAGQSWNGQACVAVGGGLLSAPCTPAQALDPSTNVIATQALTPLAMQQAPGATAVGAPASGNFQPGQCIEVQVTLNPGKCYTAVAMGSPGEEVDVQLAPAIPPPLPSVPFAQDNQTGSTAVMGGNGSCFKWAAPIPTPAKLVLRVPSGQGMAAAQLFEK